ncbi:hypothetical protein [Candidatus Symbiobacter mobilis]|uniref:MORN repeat protein n=1 Tax=Candidatus Symbiobacter mobilis CR TaxID=946483 RepID=U5N3X6_9BURK|nr:hypothetical protein [Candidatus Symbiobacter mobilis]AGX86191.1 hypothetical protein Cenrod_0056 [Candidatus Symbiobacter mobilis CR]
MSPMQEFFFLPLIAFLSFSTTAVAADCLVKDTDIATEYSGDCRNGLANGEGKAIGRDQYVGGFRDGLKYGKGTYTWSNGSHYIGEYRDDKRNGFGVFTTPRTAYDNNLKSTLGVWKGDFFIEQGLFVDGTFTLRCTTKPICERQKQLEDQRKSREVRERYERACDNYYPGRVGRIKGDGWLATEDGFIVRYVNKDRKMVTIEGTSGGNSLKFGETREFSCSTLQHYER